MTATACRAYNYGTLYKFYLFTYLLTYLLNELVGIQNAFGTATGAWGGGHRTLPTPYCTKCRGTAHTVDWVGACPTTRTFRWLVPDIATEEDR